jgi:hypothetical protein
MFSEYLKYVVAQMRIRLDPAAAAGAAPQTERAQASSARPKSENHVD